LGSAGNKATAFNCNFPCVSATSTRDNINKRCTRGLRGTRLGSPRGVAVVVDLAIFTPIKPNSLFVGDVKPALDFGRASKETRDEGSRDVYISKCYFGLFEKCCQKNVSLEYLQNFFFTSPWLKKGVGQERSELAADRRIFN
jgi:hypothetical protein